MASLGRLTAALASSRNETTLALANLNFDFSLIRVEPPKEYTLLATSLSNSRRDAAEQGSYHQTARKLGILFEEHVPPIPSLIKAYGTRASEIARTLRRDSPQRQSGELSFRDSDFDATSLWAAATSGPVSIAVHLLACIISRAWSPQEAVSIWVELLEQRTKEIIETHTDKNTDNWVGGKFLVAAQQKISRQDLAAWDSSTRSWLLVADQIDRIRQTQLRLILQNLTISANGPGGVYSSIMSTWLTSLKVMEAVVSGTPLAVSDGAILIAVQSWHLYPTLIVAGGKSTSVTFGDKLVVQGGIITLGLNRRLDTAALESQTDSVGEWAAIRDALSSSSGSSIWSKTHPSSGTPATSVSSSFSTGIILRWEKVNVASYFALDLSQKILERISLPQAGIEKNDPNVGADTMSFRLKVLSSELLRFERYHLGDKKIEGELLAGELIARHVETMAAELMQRLLLASFQHQQREESQQKRTVEHDISYIIRASKNYDEIQAALQTLKTLYSTEPFSKFCRNLHQSLNQGSFTRIEKEILNAFNISKEKDRARILIQWDVARFITEELEVGQDLNAVFTITGSSSNAFADTSAEYMRSTWPTQESSLLSAISQFYQNGTPEKQLTYLPGRERTRPTVVFNKNQNESLLVLDVVGTRFDIIDIAQQLAWIAAAFRVASDDELLYSRTVFKRDGETRNFYLNLAPLSPLENLQISCWHPLCLGSVIVSDFPIPQRGEFVGLEVPFDVMAYLAGIRCSVAYKEGLVLKGDLHVLVPTVISSECAQWHCVSTKAFDKTDLGILSELCPEMAETKEFNALKGAARAFLGYCQSINVCLATQGSAQCSIKVSNADYEKSGVRISRTIATQAGFSMFASANIVNKIRFSKKLRGTTESKHISYGVELERARNNPLLLYDLATKRGWLVPELSVVLQFAQLYISSRIDLDENVRTNVPYASLASDGGSEALKAIRSAEHLVLRDSGGYSPPETFNDIVKCIMDALGSRRTKNIEISSENDISLKGSSTLYGWDAKEIVDMCYVWDRRQTTINRITGGTWYTEISNRPNILTLFCRDLGEPLIPAEDGIICSSWNPVPQGNDYLVASVRCMNSLQITQKSIQKGLRTRIKLSELPGYKVFESCDFGNGIGCNRLQEFKAYQAKEIGRNSYASGAVIFGNPRRYLVKPCKRRRMVNIDVPGEVVNTVPSPVRSNTVQPHEEGTEANAAAVNPGQEAEVLGRQSTEHRLGDPMEDGSDHNIPAQLSEGNISPLEENAPTSSPSTRSPSQDSGTLEIHQSQSSTDYGSEFSPMHGTVAWSLPLSSAQVNRQPISEQRTTLNDGRKITFRQLTMIALGSIMSSWKISDWGPFARFFARLEPLLAEEHSTRHRLNGQSHELHWLRPLIAEAMKLISSEIESKREAEKFVRLGMRRMKTFVGTPEEAPPPYFGLSPDGEEDLSSTCILDQIRSAMSKCPRYIKSLIALQIAWEVVYDNIGETLIPFEITQQPLCQSKWLQEILKDDNEDNLRWDLDSPDASEAIFACIAMFESGYLNLEPNELKSVIGISSGGDILLSGALVSNPCGERVQIIKRIPGKVGVHPESTSLLASPEWKASHLSVADWRNVFHGPFNGELENCFRGTTLHLRLTGRTLPFLGGVNACEAIISVYDRGKWVADIDIHGALNHSLLHLKLPWPWHWPRPRLCEHYGRGRASLSSHILKQKENVRLISIENWDELLDHPDELDTGVVKCFGNWEARLATACVSVHMGLRTLILPAWHSEVCYGCIESGGEEVNEFRQSLKAIQEVPPQIIIL